MDLDQKSSMDCGSVYSWKIQMQKGGTPKNTNWPWAYTASEKLKWMGVSPEVNEGVPLKCKRGVPLKWFAGQGSTKGGTLFLYSAPHRGNLSSKRGVPYF